MDVLNWKDREDVKIDKFPYRGNSTMSRASACAGCRKPVRTTWAPGIRTAPLHGQPGGEIPIHNHFYQQTMYILSGRFECYQYDSETDKPVKSVVCGPGDAIYLPSMEPHGMRNISDNETATFLCCICNVYDKESL